MENELKEMETHSSNFQVPEIHTIQDERDLIMMEFANRYEREHQGRHLKDDPMAWDVLFMIATRRAIFRHSPMLQEASAQKALVMR